MNNSVIVQNRIKASVNAVVDVIHVMNTGVPVDRPFAVNVCDEGEGRSSHKSSRFRDDVNLRPREKIVQSFVYDFSNLVDRGTLVPRESTSDVQNVKAVSDRFGIVEQTPCSGDGSSEDGGIATARPHVEANKKKRKM